MTIFSKTHLGGRNVSFQACSTSASVRLLLLSTAPQTLPLHDKYYMGRKMVIQRTKAFLLSAKRYLRRDWRTPKQVPYHEELHGPLRLQGGPKFSATCDHGQVPQPPPPRNATDDNLRWISSWAIQLRADIEQQDKKLTKKKLQEF